MTGPKPPTPGTHSAQLLVDLVLDPRDPGYEAAASRRGGTPGRHWYDRPLVALGCLVIGFTLVTAHVRTNRGAPEAARVHDGLVSRVRAAQRTDDKLATQAQQLNAQLTTLRDAALANSGSLAGRLDRSQLLAGQIAVTGPGVEVVLTEPPAAAPSSDPGRVGTTPIAASNILTDRDVRSVVNQLWSDGAEAISVNDVRLTPTSAIRFAGEAVLVDFQPISSPYTVRAIGAADQLDTGFASSDVAGRYQTLASADGIGFTFRERTRLNLPASPSISLRFARVAQGSGK